MNLPEDFIFSQSSLHDYLECPRRFQLRYLLQQRWPGPEVDDLLAFEERMRQGERFHHLIHQHQVGIPAELLMRHISDPELRTWFNAYQARALADLPPQRYPEITLTVRLGDYLLLARYDLLAITPGGPAVIMDWKTSRYVPRTEKLAQHMQTRVYRYVLAAGGAHLNDGQPIPPEQISLVYWYAAFEGETQRFPYSEAQFAADEADLLALMTEINTAQSFPLTEETHRCRYCIYRSLCDRGREAGSLAAWEADTEAADLEDATLEQFRVDLDQIGEIAF